MRLPCSGIDGGTLRQTEAEQHSDKTFASGTEAMERVIRQQTDVLDAMFRPEVGSISFYWGTPGKGPKLKKGSGISHLIARRTAEGQDAEAVARKMVEVLAYGEIGPEYGPQGGQHRNVSYGGHTAVLSLYRFGNRETWLLTGWKDNPVDESAAVNASNSTQTGPSGIRSELGATGLSDQSIRPIGADGKPLFQEYGVHPVPRASVSLSREAAVIRLFKGSDLSSIPHESAHIFVDDLANVIADNGGAALNALRESVAASRTDMSALAPVPDGTLDVEGARGMLREARAELEALEAHISGATKQSDAQTRAELAAAREATVARRRELLPMESALAQYVRHMDGVARARADMATLRRFAGVREDGDLTAEERQQMQEHAARGFEQYLSEGKAPSAELRGVFSRMRAWLKNLYAGWKRYVGAELSDDVRRVFDRMLATDEQLRNNDSVRAALELEREFLSETDLAAEERGELDALRSQAEAEVLALMDRRTLRERRARYREYYREEKEALLEDPFWGMIAELMRREARLPGQTARSGGINKESLVHFLGEEFTRDLSKKMPGLVNARGGGRRVDSLALEYGLADGDADGLPACCMTPLSCAMKA